jgi:hypothetical protein
MERMRRTRSDGRKPTGVNTVRRQFSIDKDTDEWLRELVPDQGRSAFVEGAINMRLYALQKSIDEKYEV